MSIQTEINRLIQAKASLIAQIEAKGVSVPADASLDDLAALVQAITGGEDLTEVLADQDDLIAQILTALEGKAAGGGGSTEPDPHEPYQRVEYITSDGEAYLLTDFIADNDCGLEIVASFPTLLDRVPMGSRVDSGANRFYCAYPLSASSCYYGFNTGSSFSCALTVDTKYRLQTNFLNSRLVNVYDADGIRKGGTSISQTLVQQTCPMAIFGYNRTDTGVGTKREFTLCTARISKGYKIAREYTPCYRKSDGVAGVYEETTGEFITTPVGAFTCGPGIDW